MKKRVWIETGVSLTGLPSAMLLDEWGHSFCGGPLSWIREEVLRQSYETLGEFPRGSAPEFPVRDYLAEPKDLSNRGKTARQIILAVLTKHSMTNTGGCPAFYSPKEWAEREEEYGLESELIVCYDGGCLRPFFSMGAAYDTLAGAPGVTNCYVWIEEMQKALETEGFFVEECTGWYAAVYNK